MQILTGDIITYVDGIAAVFYGIYLMRKSKLPEVMAVWNEIWSKDTEA